ncbi:hypothetical protein [Planktothrix agardhii]|uniref:hypothetical protein n=1 Tax=Planktothrix agardhii TaxID=1160 RepID=UPI0003FC454F|nr:hypothetical protein [Planktothrix agardhii]CAD0231090.1 conserved hypothetical protein [Planktothrix agardhii]
MQSGFWLVLPEKSNSGFPVVNPAYEAAIASIIYLLKGLLKAIAIPVSHDF